MDNEAPRRAANEIVMNNFFFIGPYLLTSS
jgi:hypothetical protein